MLNAKIYQIHTHTHSQKQKKTKAEYRNNHIETFPEKARKKTPKQYEYMELFSNIYSNTQS